MELGTGTTVTVTLGYCRPTTGAVRTEIGYDATVFRATALGRGAAMVHFLPVG